MPFLLDCFHNNCRVRATKLDWYDNANNYSDWLYKSKSAYSSSTTRLEIQIVLPESIMFTLDSEIYIAKCNSFGEDYQIKHEAEHATLRKIDNIIENRDNSTGPMVNDPKELVAIFRLLELIFLDNDLAIFKHVIHIKNR